MLGLPWWVAPRDLRAGDVVHIGRRVVEGTHPPVATDVTYTLAQDTPAGTILAADSDRRLYPLTATTRKGTRHGPHTP